MSGRHRRLDTPANHAEFARFVESMERYRASLAVDASRPTARTRETLARWVFLRQEGVSKGGFEHQSAADQTDYREEADSILAALFAAGFSVVASAERAVP